MQVPCCLGTGGSASSVLLALGGLVSLLTGGVGAPSAMAGVAALASCQAHWPCFLANAFPGKDCPAIATVAKVPFPGLCSFRPRIQHSWGYVYMRLMLIN